MKQILISIKPEWVAKILKGEKTLEIRKTAPKELPCEVFIYCTKSGLNIEKDCGLGFPERINGKVVAKFTLKRVEAITCGWRYEDCLYHYETTEMDEKELLTRSCLSKLELADYLGKDGKTISNIVGYAWHISDLEIFNQPKELSDFCTYRKPSYVLQRAPQSWGYVEERE